MINFMGGTDKMKEDKADDGGIDQRRDAALAEMSMAFALKLSRSHYATNRQRLLMEGGDQSAV